MKSKQIGYIKFEDDCVKYIVKSSDKKDEQVLFNKINTLYWPQINYIGTCFVMHSCDTMFKISHYKQSTTKDGIYYIITTFQNSYMFIKLISDQNILINNDIKLFTYQDLFNSGIQTLEMYLLIQDNSVEQQI